MKINSNISLCTQSTVTIRWIGMAVPVVALAVLTWRRQRGWKGTLASYQQKLEEKQPEQLGTSTGKNEKVEKQEWDELPPVVQRYLSRIFSSQEYRDDQCNPPALAARRPSRVSFVQHGEFFELNKSMTYEAQQTTSLNGFVWAARLSNIWLPRFLSLWIVDAFLTTEKSFAQVSLMKGVIPFLDSKPPPNDMENTFDKVVWVGEAMRWMAEAVMLPNMLLPETGIVQWKEAVTTSSDNGTKNGNQTQAILELVAPPPPFVFPLKFVYPDFPPMVIRMTATFDSTHGYLTRLQGERPYLHRQDKTFSIRTWVAAFDDYMWFDAEQMWVPTKLKAGWKKAGSSSSPSSKDDEVVFAVHAEQTQIVFHE